MYSTIANLFAGGGGGGRTKINFTIAAVEISGTSATLGATKHTMTCSLMGSGATFLMYQWRIGGSIRQPFMNNSNQFIISPVGVSDARNDYSCDVMAAGETYTATASLRVSSEYYNAL